MLVLAAVLVLVALGVWLYCLFEVLSTNEGETRHLPKFVWFMIVLLGFDLGAVAWLLFGRRRGFVTADVAAWPRSSSSPGTATSANRTRPIRWARRRSGVPRSSTAACVATTRADDPGASPRRCSTAGSARRGSPRSAQCGRALPLSHVFQDMVQNVQPLPGSSLRSVPVTSTTSPRWAML